LSSSNVEVVGRTSPLHYLEKTLDIITRISILISGGSIVLLSLVMTYSVVRRYVFHSPDNVAYQVICLFMLIAVAFCLGRIQYLKQNITVDYFSHRFPRIVRFILLDIFAPILGLGFCIVLAWESWKNAWFAFESGQKTVSIIPWPTFPLQALIPLGVGILCLVLIFQILSAIVILASKAGKKP
jgi:TRAP-type C4-dicarboxylate transport system permease small subunit